ncbi:hypothetical protein GWI33_008127 [Rhynchophorus ferrugineus]|uniref:Uncharacterized protein n=1 Tax=Rhynchophorus ferrugineus TaxID=354439 RepID=A0A834IDD5_RHYFE|nr:hypothetical protein GWI33_008127 [Rhynchophorus ferrugineus]
MPDIKRGFASFPVVQVSLLITENRAQYSSVSLTQPLPLSNVPAPQHSLRNRGDVHYKTAVPPHQLAQNNFCFERTVLSHDFLTDHVNGRPGLPSVRLCRTDYPRPRRKIGRRREIDCETQLPTSAAVLSPFRVAVIVDVNRRPFSRYVRGFVTAILPPWKSIMRLNIFDTRRRVSI